VTPNHRDVRRRSPAGSAREEPGLSASLLRVEAGVEAARTSLKKTHVALAKLRSRLEKGVPLTDALEMIAENRKATAEALAAFESYERALSQFRAAEVRVFVDRFGLSFAAVAGVFGFSRQRAARLYHAVEPLVPPD
jgi:hypothetical protein